MSKKLTALLVCLLPTLVFAANEKPAAPADAPKAAASPAPAPAAKKPARRVPVDADARHCLEEFKDNLSVARCAERYR